MIPADIIKARKAELLGGEDEDRIDPETAGRFAFLDGKSWHDNPHAEPGTPGWTQPLTAIEWASGWDSEERYSKGAKWQK